MQGHVEADEPGKQLGDKSIYLVCIRIMFVQFLDTWTHDPVYKLPEQNSHNNDNDHQQQGAQRSRRIADCEKWSIYIHFLFTQISF